jgi:uroporphyrinogen decarboxylase
VKKQTGDRKVLQGNLDPSVLFAPQEKIKAETEKILSNFADGRGHVFNLGHGILPTTKPENAKFLVDSVKEISLSLRQGEAATA